MIAILTVSLGVAILALAVAIYLIVGLAMAQLRQKAYIEQLDAYIGQLEANAALLKQALEQHQERIGALLLINADLEERNECLERVQKRNLRGAIAVMPVLKREDVLGRLSEASMN